MSNLPIIITGCQRSGTTLLKLILDSHPDITALDEDVFELEDLPRYLNSVEFHPAVAFKLPVQAGSTDFFASINNLRLLWCVRDPRAVVASMIRLHMPFGPEEFLLPWAAHPMGAEKQIRIEYPRLPETVRSELATFMAVFEDIVQIEPVQRNRQQYTVMGALCWRVKNELIELYPSLGLDFHVVNYERLVSDPQPEIDMLLKHLGLAWHEDVLHHHKLHAGRSVGDTRNDRAIDSNSASRWTAELSSTEVKLVLDICGSRARALGVFTET